jgi:predicted Zn-dependent protease
MVTDGYGQLADGDAQKALKTGNDARDADPLSDQPYFLIATAQNNLHKPGAADNTLLTIAAQQPANPDTWLRLAGYRLNTEDDPAGAISALRPLLYVSPNNERGILLLGQARTAQTEQLVAAEVEKERQKLKREIAKLKRQAKKAIAQGGGPTPATQ